MYDHREIEEKWKKHWEKNKVFRTDTESNKEKHYSLVMFPYPSGSGIHLGHVRVFVGWDIFSRFKRMQGYEVLSPMGWDAFGLPAEEYAIKHKEHPSKSTEANISNIRKQFKDLGLGVDWDREIDTTDPKYYKWTQWIFLLLYKRGLAYEINAPVNWCPKCLTGLANEDLEDGKCERCGSVVGIKKLRQWVLRITDYADELLEDLNSLNKWPEFVKDIQRNWIGRSEGYEIPFEVPSCDITIKIFTTRPDTLFGCSFIVISPEASILDTILLKTKNKTEVEEYQEKSFVKKENERNNKIQTGVICEGVKAIHPITKEEIPVYVADYVLGGYGTGVVFGCPAHDERDFSFAKKYKLPINRVIEGDEDLPTTDLGSLINSGKFNGLEGEKAKDALTKESGGKKAISYKLQDWLFSRQRYWGEPIPLIHCEKCGVVPVPEEDLPVTLPNIESYEPTGTGESPLADIEEWVNVSCPKCNGPGKRETNTMPQWAGSSWYHLRYIDPNNDKEIINKGKEKKWMPVDTYVGGLEHAARHLIYARFWHKVLHDAGFVHTKEPYIDIRHVGILQSKESSRKLSKRDGDAASPDEIISTLGADTLRVAVASIAPFSHATPWHEESIIGPRRLIEKIYTLHEKIGEEEPSKELLTLQHKTIASVKKDYEDFAFNTAVSSIIILSNELHKHSTVPRETYKVMLQLLAPLAPFATQELWEKIGEEGSIHHSEFPTSESKYTIEEESIVVIQINGKPRGTVTVRSDASEKDVLKAISELPKIQEQIDGKKVKIYIPGKIISFI